MKIEIFPGQPYMLGLFLNTIPKVWNNCNQIVRLNVFSLTIPCKIKCILSYYSFSCINMHIMLVYKDEIVKVILKIYNVVKNLSHWHLSPKRRHVPLWRQAHVAQISNNNIVVFFSDKYLSLKFPTTMLLCLLVTSICRHQSYF